MLRYHRYSVTMKMRGFHHYVVLHFEQYAAAPCDRGNDAADHVDTSLQVVHHENLHVVRALEVHNGMGVSLDGYGSDLLTTVRVRATATIASCYNNLD